MIQSEFVIICFFFKCGSKIMLHILFMSQLSNDIHIPNTNILSLFEKKNNQKFNDEGFFFKFKMKL